MIFWSLEYALLEVFSIHPEVLPFQGVGTEQHGKRLKTHIVGNLSGMDIGAERKWTTRRGFDNNVCDTGDQWSDGTFGWVQKLRKLNIH